MIGPFPPFDRLRSAKWLRAFFLDRIARKVLISPNSVEKNQVKIVVRQRWEAVGTEILRAFDAR
jgi:hypothetical protein